MKDLHDEIITSVCFSSCGRYVLTNSRDHSLKWIDLRQYKILYTFEDMNYVNTSVTNTASLSPSDKYAVVGSKNGQVLILNMKTGVVEEMYENEHFSGVVSSQWHPMGGRFGTLDSAGNLFFWS